MKSVIVILTVMSLAAQDVNAAQSCQPADAQQLKAGDSIIALKGSQLMVGTNIVATLPDQETLPVKTTSNLNDAWWIWTSLGGTQGWLAATQAFSCTDTTSSTTTIGAAVDNNQLSALIPSMVACRNSLSSKLQSKFYTVNSTCVDLGNQINQTTAAFLAMENADANWPLSSFTVDYETTKIALCNQTDQEVGVLVSQEYSNGCAADGLEDGYYDNSDASDYGNAYADSGSSAMPQSPNNSSSTFSPGQGSTTPTAGGGYVSNNGTIYSPTAGGGYVSSSGTIYSPTAGGGYVGSDGTITTPIAGGGYVSSNGTICTPVAGGGFSCT